MMAEDTQFNTIIQELQAIHRDFPDLRFGAVVQMALDENKRSQNNDLNDVSSKKFLTAIQGYKQKMLDAKNTNQGGGKK